MKKSRPAILKERITRLLRGAFRLEKRIAALERRVEDLRRRGR